MNAEQFIREQVRRILLEREEEPSGEEETSSSSRLIVKGSIPGAIPKGFKALADSDPKELMKNLKATGSYTHSDPAEALKKLLDAGVKGTGEMKSAFKGSKIITDKNGKKGVLVGVGEIDNKNGTRYLKMLMQAALKVGTLKPPDSVRVQHTSAGVLVYFSKNGNNTWDK